ncbi:MAG TPA: hypothetical protein VD861_05895 [Pyrinomonadaceae bacterium]|nr:hypothetical protein [Pyrinomonadaceae bacterium]
MQWEYLVKNSWLSEGALDRLGEDEWELVTIVNEPEMVWFFFKRPIEDDEDEDEGEDEDE